MMWRRLRRPRLRAYLDAPVAAHRLAWALAALLALGLTGATAFYLGYDHALKRIGASAEEVERLRAGSRAGAQGAVRLQEQLALLRQQRDMAVETARKLQEDSKGQMNDLAAMRDQLAVYQRLLGEKGISNGLSLESFRVTRAGNGAYQYRVLLTQAAASPAEVAGTVTIRILGAGGQPAVTAPFRFRYFQAVTGELVLPKGVQPESADVIVSSDGRKGPKVEKRFKWEVGG